MDLSKRLEPGENLLAVSAKNEGENPNPAGLVAWLKVEFTEGEPLLLVTDDEWKSSDKQS